MFLWLNISEEFKKACHRIFTWKHRIWIIGKKYNMGSQTPIIVRVKTYKSQGMEGLKRRKTKKEYSAGAQPKRSVPLEREKNVMKQTLLRRIYINNHTQL